MPRQVVWLAAALLLVGVAMPMLAALVVGGWGYGMMGPGMMGGWWALDGAAGWAWPLAAALSALGMLAFWAGAIVGIVALVRWVLSAPAQQRPTSEPSCWEIVRQRYARGEIDEATYERMRKEFEQPVG